MMSKSLLLLLTGCLLVLAGTSQNIYTKAGTSNPGDFQQATGSQLLYPRDVVIDASGNIFISDATRIRKINASDGKIYTIAGNGQSGFSGDGGPAIKAAIGVGGMALNAAGDIIFGDGSDRIRKISASDGKITTIAGTGVRGFSGDGGAAINAQFYIPNDVAIDAAGNIYISDAYNYRIRKISVTDGKISTIAGNGTSGFSGDGGAATSAQFSLANSIAVDAAGNVFITDVYNNRIRKINAADGKISTIAGTDMYGEAGNGGPAVNATIGQPVGITVDNNNNIVFSDSDPDFYRYRVRKINVTDGTINVVAGSGVGPGQFSGDGGPATVAALYNPIGVAFDKTGNLFIADAGNTRVRKVSVTDQVITTISGTSNNNSAGVPTTPNDPQPASVARLNVPAGAAVDAAGNVYISDNANNAVRKISAADGIITTIAGAGASGFSGDGGPAKTAKLNLGFSIPSPGGIAVDKAGNIYIADLSNYRVRKINAADGTINTVAGNGVNTNLGDGGAATAASIGMPIALAFDSKGNLYIVSYGVSRVRKVNMTDGTISTAIGNGTSYRGSAANGDGGPATAAKLQSLRSIAIDGSDNIYIGEGFKIRKVNAGDGIINTIAGSSTSGFSGDGGPATAALLNAVMGLAADAANNLYIADYNFDTNDPAVRNHIIRKINGTNGTISTIAGKGTRGFSGDGGVATRAEFANPCGVTLDANGNLFITDQGNNRIRYVCIKEGLATANIKDTRPAYPEDSSTTVNFNNNCSVICNLSPVGAQPVTGFIDGKVWIESDVVTAGDQPYVQRHYDIAPLLNAGTATGSVDLYFTQTELNAYNASAKVKDATYMQLPSNATDTSISHVRVAYKSGASNNNTGLPGTYSGTTTVIIPDSTKWDAAMNWWKVSFTAKGLGGFFVITEKTPPPPIPAAHNLFVPNMFSPNGDGKNDILKVFGNHIASARLQIFNQWGQKIFESRNGDQQGWDGRVNGKNQPTGVYIYTLDVKLDDGSTLQRKGSISLIR